MTENKTFSNIDFTTTFLVIDEYDNCIFDNCDFSNGNLNNLIFTDCEFVDCNLSLCKTQYTAFKTVEFNNCKLLGVDFSECNPFLLNMVFNDCLMNLTSFYQLNFKRKHFSNCSLQEADFTESNLSETSFINCDLKQAIFVRTNLEKVNFLSAKNYTINPENNRLKNAIFSKDNLSGLLTQFKIKIK